MKKASLVLLITLASSVLLFGCGKKKTDEVTTVTIEDSTAEASTETSTETSTEADLNNEEEVDGMIRSPLTNEWVDESFENKRPISVMINNLEGALPQSSISKADILYECSVEADITRLMAVILDWEDIEKIGPVRSVRDYYVYWAYEWDAVICHFGGPSLYVDAVLSNPYTNNLDGTGLDSGSASNTTVYYRDPSRKAPHNAYTSGEGIDRGIEKFDYSKEYTDYYQGAHYNFAAAKNPTDLSSAKGVVNASKVDLAGSYPIDTPYFEYNEDDGLYYRYEYGSAHVDKEDGSQLKFKNIIIQSTYYEVRDDNGYLAFQDHDEGQEGYFITNGKAIHVTWEKHGDFGATRYYDDNGDEIELNTGKTMVCIIKNDTYNTLKFK